MYMWSVWFKNDSKVFNSVLRYNVDYVLRNQKSKVDAVQSLTTRVVHSYKTIGQSQSDRLSICHCHHGTNLFVYM